MGIARAGRVSNKLSRSITRQLRDEHRSKKHQADCVAKPDTDTEAPNATGDNGARFRCLGLQFTALEAR